MSVKSIKAGFPVQIPLARREKYMSFKKLLKNSEAVSPVIGVILMVAITVILAAAIGSSVFGDGPTDSAPQANLEISPVNISGSSNNIAYVKLEHIGGDPIHFEDTSAVKVTASLKGAIPVNIYVKDLGTVGIGDMKSFPLYGVNTDTGASTNGNAFATNPAAGDNVNIKIIDLKTNQLITDQDIRLIK